MLRTHTIYRPDIDGLRAIAVLSVVGYHAFPGKLPGGFVGVDIFFVISGFLISSIIIDNTVNKSFSFIDFYARRIKRIFPALVLILTFCSIFGWFFLLESEYYQLGKHILSGSLFVSNFVLWGESGYFDSSVENKPLLHLWSLSIEEQFYIVWPFIVYLGCKAKLNITWLILIILSISLSYCVWQTQGGNYDAAFYSPLTRFWELLLGAFLAVVVLNSKKQLRIELRNLLSISGFALVVTGLFYISHAGGFPSWLALIPTVGTVFIIVAGPDALLNRKILSNKAAVWIGLISYPLYLWHWPLLSFMRILEGGKPVIMMRISAVLLSIILAWLTYICVEKPIRLKWNQKSSLPLLIGSMIFIGLFGISVVKTNGYQEREVLKNLTLTERVKSQLGSENWKYKKNDNCIRSYLYGDVAIDSWNFCVKNINYPPRILLLGNSFANHLYPGFVANKQLKNHSILSIGDFNASGYEPNFPEKADFVNYQKNIIDGIISEAVSIQYVVISGLDDFTNEMYIQNIISRIKFIQKYGKKVVIFLPHIKMTFDPKYCFSRPQIQQKKNCNFDNEVWEEKIKNFQPFIDLVLKNNPGVLFYDPNELFCKNNKCSFIKDGIPLYRDQVHLSEYGSIKLAELFEEWVKINIPSLINDGIAR